ncbi:MAG: HAD-IA family hydrolase [Candidatus Marinimicrobia bacterium]|nr:HAD-IA family hydrolase [Candidatus Neomarinimicrobiota bacterium]
MKKHQFRAILFDLDGTLINSSRDIVTSVNLTLNHFGFNPIDHHKCVGFIGDGIRMLVKRAFAQVLFNDPESDLDAELLNKADIEYRKIYSEHLLDTSLPYPDVNNTLIQLTDLPMAVISNKAFIYTKQILEHFDLVRFFDPILGGDSLYQKKPDQAPLLHVANQYHISPYNCLMVGDSEKDIAAAQAAGMPVCAVTYGMRPKVILEDMNPDFLVDSFPDLLKIIGL